ncbi:MAG: hypothetical protein CL872_03725 [Dehalococcoidaceae bacterium]|nr:hypothetical protein [Dehalococcoidaceae bacterium]|tara:strand:+ start:3365 stop:3925 length:561 start_codon:yes stop_codon:yes gene_type:complete
MFLDFGPFEEYIGLLIFLARMLDVTLGTIRNLYVNAGLKISSAVAGFFQMIVWVFAVAGLVNDLNDISRIILYALGFSAGTIAGIWIEDKIALGFRSVRIMNQNQELSLANILRDKGYNITQIPAQGYKDKVEVVIAILSRKEIDNFTKLVEKIAPNVFYTIEKVDKPHRFTNNQKSIIDMFRIRK